MIGCFRFDLSTFHNQSAIYCQAIFKKFSIPFLKKCEIKRYVTLFNSSIIVKMFECCIQVDDVIYFSHQLCICVMNVLFTKTNLLRLVCKLFFQYQFLLGLFSLFKQSEQHGCSRFSLRFFYVFKYGNHSIHSLFNKHCKLSF